MGLMASRSPARISVALVDGLLTVIPQWGVAGFPCRRRMPLLASVPWVGLRKKKIILLLKVMNL